MVRAVVVVAAVVAGVMVAAVVVLDLVDAVIVAGVVAGRIVGSVARHGGRDAAADAESGDCGEDRDSAGRAVGRGVLPSTWSLADSTVAVARSRIPWAFGPAGTGP